MHRLVREPLGAIFFGLYWSWCGVVRSGILKILGSWCGAVLLVKFENFPGAVRSDPDISNSFWCGGVQF